MQIGLFDRLQAGRGNIWYFFILVLYEYHLIELYIFDMFSDKENTGVSLSYVRHPVCKDKLIKFYTIPLLFLHTQELLKTVIYVVTRLFNYPTVYKVRQIFNVSWPSTWYWIPYCNSCLHRISERVPYLYFFVFSIGL